MNKTREIGSCEECDSRRLERLQGEQDTSTRTRVIPVVDRSSSSFYIAFGAVEDFGMMCTGALTLWEELQRWHRSVC